MSNHLVSWYLYKSYIHETQARRYGRYTSIKRNNLPKKKKKSNKQTGLQ